jgi:hypothetical protein
MKSGKLNFPEPSGPLQACNGTALPLCQCTCVYIIHYSDFITSLYITAYSFTQYNAGNLKLRKTFK